MDILEVYQTPRTTIKILETNKRPIKPVNSLAHEVIPEVKTPQKA
jgi:hypothetical protein